MTNPLESATSIADPDLQRALQAIDTVTADMAAAAWSVAPTGRWHCANILEHLGKTYERTAYILDKCVTDGAPKGRPPSWRQRAIAIAVVRIGYFPTGIKAPEMTIPEGLAGEQALAYARRELQALDAAANRCEARFGSATCVANHPILGGFTVPQWRQFHWRHTKHHARQIAALRRGLGLGS
jgi:hypothetical protein